MPEPACNPLCYTLHGNPALPTRCLGRCLSGAHGRCSSQHRAMQAQLCSNNIQLGHSQAGAPCNGAKSLSARLDCKVLQQPLGKQDPFLPAAFSRRELPEISDPADASRAGWLLQQDTVLLVLCRLLRLADHDLLPARRKCCAALLHPSVFPCSHICVVSQCLTHRAAV